MASGSRAVKSVPQDSRASIALPSGRRAVLRGLPASCLALGLLGLAGPTSAAVDMSPARIAASNLIRPGDPVYGNPRGTVTIVDFYDIRCPPCRAMNLRIQTLIKAENFVRYVPVDYPILGPASVLGVKALFAAAMQGKYTALRAILMVQKQKPDMAVLQRDAKQIGLDWPRLELDMNGDRVAARIQRNLRRGRAIGVHGIPTFFVGPKRVAGALSYDDLRDLVAEVESSANEAKNS